MSGIESGRLPVLPVLENMAPGRLLYAQFQAGSTELSHGKGEVAVALPVPPGDAQLLVTDQLGRVLLVLRVRGPVDAGVRVPVDLTGLWVKVRGS